MSRSRINLPYLLLNSVVLVIMTVMTVEIEENSESKSSLADLKPNFSSICPIPDPGIFTEKPNHQDNDSFDNQHPMILPTSPTDKDNSEENAVIKNGCYQIAKDSRVRKTPQYSTIPVNEQYKQ